MPDFAYIAEVRCRSLETQLLINNWPAYRTIGEPVMANIKLNLWLLEGRNVVRILMAPCEPVEGLREPDYGFRLFRAVPDDREYIHDDPMLLFRWTEDQYPLAERDAPIEVFRHEFVMHEAFGPWGWESARPYLAADRGDIAKLMMAVHDALARRDRTAVKQLMAMRQEEWGRALGVPEAEMSDDLDRILDVFFNDDDWHMLPLEEAALRLDSGADGRLVQVVAQNPDTGFYGPPLQGLGEGGKPFELQVCVSCVGGSWTIVR